MTPEEMIAAEAKRLAQAGEEVAQFEATQEASVTAEPIASANLGESSQTETDSADYYANHAGISGAQANPFEAAFMAARAAAERKIHRIQIASLVIGPLAQIDLNATPISLADRAVRIADALLDRVALD